MNDNQGGRDGEGKIETHNQRPRENSGGSSDYKTSVNRIILNNEKNIHSFFVVLA